MGKLLSILLLESCCQPSGDRKGQTCGAADRKYNQYYCPLEKKKIKKIYIEEFLIENPIEDCFCNSYMVLQRYHEIGICWGVTSVFFPFILKKIKIKIITVKSSMYENRLIILNDWTFIYFSTLQDLKTPLITSLYSLVRSTFNVSLSPITENYPNKLQKTFKHVGSWAVFIS